ncbi:hypothetical protein ANACOL_04275 [Anaerotruncus colihominis DSM 17241]|uniref:Uncharacterized protein n=1 Tax=Anaerotruncus colihominis DSM 17241 TaxID=445972 RepID=B0PHI2_9FIRM|nr:hypothetical protein ANACOL_04275 [Anaerotruncus colihominis DSM 17241]
MRTITKLQKGNRSFANSSELRRTGRTKGYPACSMNLPQSIGIF